MVCAGSQSIFLGWAPWSKSWHYRYIAVGYGVVTYPKIFQCWRRSSRCTCTIAQFRCSKLPLKFLHARTCRILSVFGYRVLDTWFEGKRVLGIKTHACVQKTYMDTDAVVAPAFTYANKLEGFARLPYKSIGTFWLCQAFTASRFLAQILHLIAR